METTTTASPVSDATPVTTTTATPVTTTRKRKAAATTALANATKSATPCASEDHFDYKTGEAKRKKLEGIVKKETGLFFSAFKSALPHAKLAGEALIELAVYAIHGDREAQYISLGLNKRTAQVFQQIARNWEEVEAAGANTVTAALEAISKPKPKPKQIESTPPEPTPTPTPAPEPAARIGTATVVSTQLDAPAAAAGTTETAKEIVADKLDASLVTQPQKRSQQPKSQPQPEPPATKAVTLLDRVREAVLVVVAFDFETPDLDQQANCVESMDDLITAANKTKARWTSTRAGCSEHAQ